MLRGSGHAAEKTFEVVPFILSSFYPFPLSPPQAACDFENGNCTLRTHREEKVDAPIVLVKWYDWTRWILERVDSFPKNQRFIFGTRLADRSLRVLEILVDASYRARKVELLADANRQIEVLRWLVRLAKDRKLLTVRQYGYACQGLTECGRMVGGWLKQAARKETSTDAPAQAPF